MELRDFVKETIVQISQGIKDSQFECLKLGCIVNPIYQSGLSNYTENNGNTYPLKEIEFEIGLTEANGNEKSGGIGVFLGTINLGGKNSVESELKSVTNVKFKIPIAFPSLKNVDIVFDK